MQDDAADFLEVLAGFESMGLAATTAQSVFSLLSGVLLMGNIKIEQRHLDGLPDAAAICEEDRADFEVKSGENPHILGFRI